VEELPHVAAWREAYRAFGAKPQRTRNSLEALLRRAGNGLPRVNRLTDTYNAISVLHQVPVGGEDLTAYAGAPRLVRATGHEVFDTVADGRPVVEHPEPGEAVWRDDHGVTCRRWNWRQGRRTQLTSGTTAALFILDALGTMTDQALSAAGEDLVDHLHRARSRRPRRDPDPRGGRVDHTYPGARVTLEHETLRDLNRPGSGGKWRSRSAGDDGGSCQQVPARSELVGLRE
jgi:DNA/RNA-binding domain of Phe-tRNA-synthetase-like protein